MNKCVRKRVRKDNHGRSYLSLLNQRCYFCDKKKSEHYGKISDLANKWMDGKMSRKNLINGLSREMRRI